MTTTSRQEGRDTAVKKRSVLDYEDEDVLSTETIAAISLVSVIETSALLYTTMKKKPRLTNKGSVIIRNRRTVSSVMYELGGLSSRYFRMNQQTFWNLVQELKPKILLILASKRQPNTDKKKRGSPPNGPISIPVRVAAAIRYFAGGSPLDIALVFGINHVDVFKSVWVVVDAINNSVSLNINFPKSYEEQKKVAVGFKSKSAAGFDCCVGAIDGMLVWINKPTKKECEAMKIGPKKFYCGRKKKFALNLQGICDAEYRFLDVSIKHPGATSDYLSFRTSTIHHKVEEESFLLDGLALFGDNAYVSNAYMVTPFKAVSHGPKDAFNFYQSQVRISIECAFGILVHRWGILRKPIPVNVSVAKTCALVVALCKLHNYCINNNDSKPPSLSAQDMFTISSEGAIPLDETQGNSQRPSQLLGGNDHPTDDFDRATMSRELRQASSLQNSPRDNLLSIIQENNLQRVLPNDWIQEI